MAPSPHRLIFRPLWTLKTISSTTPAPGPDRPQQQELPEPQQRRQGGTKSVNLQSPRNPNRIMTWITLASSGVVLFWTVWTSHLLQFTTGAGRLPDAAEWQALIDELKAGDQRMVRYDATELTKQRQPASCKGRLNDAFLTIVAAQKDHQEKGLACEFATFCITDNPTNRDRMTEFADMNIYFVLANLVQSRFIYTSAACSQLIYITAFSHPGHHQAFQQVGAVQSLAMIVKDDLAEKRVQSFQVMWAMAALQNLAATYCDTPNDGRCYWEWHPRNQHNIPDVVLTADSLPMTSSGKVAREIMRQDFALVQRVIELACTGPVKGKKSKRNPYPGSNAAIDKHDDSPNLLAWAAAGVIKNLALDPAAKPMLEPAIPCLCRLAHSKDWLERNKGEGALNHLRRADPCWFGESGTDYKYGELCVDQQFLDKDGYTCTDYGGATDEECDKPNRQGVTPRQACCACGGGSRQTSTRKEEL